MLIVKYLKKIKKMFHAGLIYVLSFIFLVVPVKKKKCLFISDTRIELGGNLKFMYDYIPSSYDKVIILKHDRRDSRGILGSIKLIYALATSKYIFLEDLVSATAYFHFKKSQEIVQLWHGPGAFKKFGYCRDDISSNHIHKGYKRYTKAIVSGNNIRQCYADAFGMDISKVQATGFPRTDLFFNKKYMESEKKKIYKKYPFLKNKKVILFAPTYRGTQFSEAHYDIEKLNLDDIYNKFSKEDYVFVFKWHPFLTNNIEKGIALGYDKYKNYKDFYYDLSSEADINDLLLITDVLVTDYSSVIFDYFFMEKPIVYFAYDEDEYANDRGLFFPFNDYVYGSVAKNSKELIKMIEMKKIDKAQRKKFKEKFLDECDGNSTKKTYEWVFNNKISKR